MNQFIMNDFDDLLAGCDRFSDRLTCGFVLYSFDKVAGDRQGNVSLEQCNTHLTQGGFYVILGQGTLFGEAVEYTTKAF